MKSYWNIGTGERYEEGQDRPTGKYIKTSPITILFLGPVLGLIYAAFLPFIGIYIVAELLTHKFLNRVSTFNWMPATAFFSGRNRKSKK